MLKLNQPKRLWNRIPRLLRRVIAFVAFLFFGALVLAFACWWYLNPAVQRTNGIEYGERNGKPLLLDVIQPGQPNGIGVALMVSGSWKSKGAGEAPVWLIAPLLRRGYTIFAIYHISQPEVTVEDIIEDVHRGIRFVRHNAEEYGIDPNRIGITGGSSGGHLSLMLATSGGPGAADVTDPIDQESSSVQAVAIFFPVTDLLNLGDSTENPGDGGPPISFVDAFRMDPGDMPAWKVIGRECSPIYHVTESLPPTLIFHGDADTLVPLDQSQRFRDLAVEKGCNVSVVIHPGGEHGWPTMLFDLWKFADWFDRHLREDVDHF